MLPQVRILTWGYDVQIQQIFASASKATVFQHAETLLCDLATLRRSQLDKERPIIFIAHSLGGIVVKEALCLSRKESTFFQEIFPATRGVMFLGTPHRGSRIASLGKIAFGLSRVFFQDPNLTILRSLEVGSEGLERIGKSFSEMISTHKIFVHTFREELDTRGVMIVDSFSSTIGHPKESTSAIHANHRNMGRFSGMEDVGFKRVCGVLQRWGDFLAEQSKISSNWSMFRPKHGNAFDITNLDSRWNRKIQVESRRSLEKDRLDTT